MLYKKYYSQVFLINKNIIKKIINIIKKFKNKYNCILEIGPGKGCLSKFLIKLPKTKRIYLVEIDKIYYIKLTKRFNKYKYVKTFNKNILNFKLKKYKKIKKFLIVGNFPYNISSKLILWFIKNKDKISECFGCFQKEFIENIIYKNKKYKTKLSLIFNIYFKLKKKIIITKDNFYPIPKIDSIFVNIIPKKNKYYIKNKKNFFLFIKEIFKYKRKILKNSFKLLIKNKRYIYKNKIFYKRPEDLTIKNFINLYKKYLKLKQ